MTSACANLPAPWSEIDQLDGHFRPITFLDPFGLANRFLDRQHVGTLFGVREDRRLPFAAADTDLDPDRSEPAARPVGDLTDLLGDVLGQADEGPGLPTAGVPDPELGIEHDDHRWSVAHGTDNSPRLDS